MAEGKTVCVTGATGFIASWIVKMLLERGYTVRGTIRNPEKAKYLMQFPGANERLQLLQADLLTPGSFDSVVQGCDGVFHTASPVIPYDQEDVDPETQLLDPAIKGTVNVLESCAKAKGLKRVVLTSSIGAVAYTPHRVPGAVLDESSWSDIDHNRDNKLWYVLSKTLAEKAAWDLAKQQDLDMVVVNPSGVFGPVLNDSLSMSNELLLNILNGKSKVIPNWVIGQVGVKDVAMAHILAYEHPEAEGRYICSERVAHFSELFSLLAKLYPEYHIEAKQDNGPPRLAPYKLSSEKIKKLGLTFQPMEDVVHETVTCFKDLKLLA
ncbi:hypothetical protein M758_11G028400 [Ceratodon purpureus]|nr:hypothetical protein M758_11G028400 [Ceratodon purpureus]